MNFFHHKDLGNHLLQLCPKVVKHPVFKKFKNLRKKLFGACLYNSLLIPSDPGDFLDLSDFMIVSDSSILIKSTQFSITFAHFPSVVVIIKLITPKFLTVIQPCVFRYWVKLEIVFFNSV
jgi:hypothetical protein